MGTSKVFFKTMGFMWMKLGLGLLTAAISVLWGALLLWINSLFGSTGVGLVAALVFWVAGTGAAIELISHYIGYLVKAGHVAIIATAVTSGQVPDHQFATAKQMVKDRFITSNVYFVVDKLVSRSVSQIQGVLQKADNLLGELPGIGTIVSILQLFVKVALDYVDECCLGYTFINKEQSACKSAADGVVIYVQNWKVLLKSAAVTTAVVIGLTFAAWILPFVIFGSIFTALSLPKWIAAILAVLVAICVKYAFIDSFMMIRTMVSYMEVAPTTQITFDLYGKLCGWSSKFKELLGKAKEEGANVYGQQENRTAAQQYGQQQYVQQGNQAAQQGNRTVQQGYGSQQYQQPQYQQQPEQPRYEQPSYEQPKPTGGAFGQGNLKQGLMSMLGNQLFQQQAQPQQYNQYGGQQGQPQQYNQYGGQQGQPQQYNQYGWQQMQPQQYNQYGGQPVQQQQYQPQYDARINQPAGGMYGMQYRQ